MSLENSYAQQGCSHEATAILQVLDKEDGNWTWENLNSTSNLGVVWR